MIDACQQANVSLGVCYRRRMFPQVLKAKELVAAGTIGEVLTVRTHCSALQDTLKAERDGFSQDWGAEPQLGGAMMEMASHRIEVLLNLMVCYAGISNVPRFCISYSQQSRVGPAVARYKMLMINVFDIVGSQAPSSECAGRDSSPRPSALGRR